TAAPARSDGSDGAAYLTESGASGPGYDPEYTMLQADVATRLFWANGDPRALRLMNLFMNQIRPRIDTTAWTIDTSGGSRHPQADRTVGLGAAAPPARADRRRRRVERGPAGAHGRAPEARWARATAPRSGRGGRAGRAHRRSRVG